MIGDTMSKRLVTTLIIIWTLLGVLAMVWYYAPAASKTDGITTYDDYAVTQSNVYISAAADGYSIVYKLTPGGALDDYWLQRRDAYYKKIELFGIEKIVYKDDLYAVCRGLFHAGGTDNLGYRVIRFDEKLVPCMDSGWLVIDGHVTGLSADEDRLYITGLSPDDTRLAVYEIKYDDLKEIETKKKNKSSESKSGNSNKDSDEEDEEFVELTPVMTDVADTGRTYVDACYEPSKLHVRYDNQSVNEDDYFLVDKSAANAYDKLKIPAKLVKEEYGLYPGLIVLIWIIGIPVLVLICVIFHNRGHFIYSAVIMTVVIAAVIAAGTFASFVTRANIAEKQYADFSAYVLGSVFDKMDLAAVGEEMGVKERVSSDTSAEELEAKLKAFYDSETCKQMLADFDTKVRLSEEGEGIYGFVLVKRSNGEVLLSNVGASRDYIGHLFGKTAADLATANSSGSHIRTASIDNGRVVFLARSLDEQGLYGCSVVALCDYGQDVIEIARENKKYIDTAIKIFLIATLLVIFVLYLQSRDVHLIAQMLKAMAEGKSNIKKPNVRGSDLVAMKNSVYEIEKNIRSVNRAKFMTFEAYYRFAPKSIEKILGKNSIVEVDVGDDTRLMGTVAIVATKGNVVAFPERTNRIFEILEESRKEQNGIYITCNETLSSARFLFADKNSNAVAFGNEVLNGTRELTNREYTNTLVLLHYTRFSYGVVGTKEQSVAYLGSNEVETLAAYTDWLRGFRLSYVATGSVIEHENCGDVRYIGFIIASDKTKIDLYELLSGSSTRVKEAKKKLAKPFEDALQLFYAQDFFLARNAFTDILRDFPEDELVKWYLFECESRLNNDTEEVFTGALHK